MYRMCTIPWPYFPNILGMDMRLRQNNLDMEEDLFLYEYAKTLVYKWQRSVGMLCSYATPFYLLTESKTEENKKVKQEEKNRKII